MPDERPIIVCGPKPEARNMEEMLRQAGSTYVACMDCNKTLMASPEAMRMPNAEFCCIECMQANNPNAPMNLMPESIDAIRVILGEERAQEAMELIGMPLSELGAENLMNPENWV